MFFNSDLINNLSGEDSVFVKDNCNKVNGGYEQKNELSGDDYARLLEIKKNYAGTNYVDVFYINAIAYYFSVHRTTYKRQGDANDDHFKAIYLFNLNEYLRQKDRPFVLFKTVEMREEAIDMVSNIFDHAFFLKKIHPEYSELQCFTEAEREFCEEKELDYIAYFEHSGNERTDWENAKNKYKERLLSEIAFYEYCDRVTNNLQGDSKSDYFNAEKKYEDWRIQKRIATLCWNKSPDIYLPKQNYWNTAGEIIGLLKNENYPYRDGNPFGDKHIIEIVDNKVKELSQ